MRGKKIISLLLVLSLILSISSIQFVFAEENVSGTEFVSEYQDEIDFLKKIKILEESFDASKTVTKAELVKMAVSMLHPDLDLSTVGAHNTFVFNDVPESHTYYPYIKIAKDIRIVYGDSVGNFNPDGLVTVTDVITVMINALGYTLYANALGGYPTGYYSVANNAGITDGIKISGDVAKGDAVAKIVYNSLFADISGIDHISKDGITIKISEDKNLLSERLGIYEYDAIVCDSGLSALDGNSVNDPERVVVEEFSGSRRYTAYTNGSDIGLYLGYRVKVYIRNNLEAARNEIVHYNVHKKVNTITLDADKIVNTNLSYVEYEENPDDLNIKKINFGDVSPILIFNGVRINTHSLTEVMPKDGIVTFIDNNQDNKYDIANVLSFNYDGVNFNAPANTIVTGNLVIDEGYESVSCIYNPANFLDLSEEKAGYMFTAFSDKDMVRTLSTYDIISVAQAPELLDGKVFYYLTVSSKPVEGTLEAIIDGKELVVGGNAYEISTALTSVKPDYVAKKVKIGSPVTLYIDINGKVGYTISAESNTKNYAYLVNAGIKGAPDDCVGVKLFTKSGEMKIYNLSRNVSIDGKKYTKLEDQLAALKIRPVGAQKAFETDTSMGRPVVIKFNSKDEIILIDTDTPNSVVTMDNADPFYRTQTAVLYSKDEVTDNDTLKAGFRSVRLYGYMSGNGSLSGKFFVTPETVVIQVPEIDTAGILDTAPYSPGTSAANYTDMSHQLIQYYELPKEDEYYKISSSAVFASGKSVDAQGYDIDPETGVAGLVIARGRNDIYVDEDSIPHGAKNSLQVFLRKSKVYDSVKEKEVWKLYYTVDGSEELSATIDTDDPTCFYAYKALVEGCPSQAPWYEEVTPIRAGDIVRIFTKADGSVEHIERAFSVERDVLEYYAFFPLPTNSPHPYRVYTSGLETVTTAPGETERSKEDHGFPFDYHDTKSTPTVSPVLQLAPAKAISGSTVQFIVPNKLYDSNTASGADMNVGELSKIDPYDPETYGIQWHKISGPALTPVTVVSFSDDGNTARVRLGTSSDIKTLSETEDNNPATHPFRDASMVLMRNSYYTIQQIIVFENLGKVNNSAIYR